MENIEALRAMLYNHPALPVICMVDSEIIAADTWSRWLGKVGEVHLEKVWIGAEGVYYYDKTGIDADAINDPNCIYPEMELTDERAKEVYDGLPWTECIVINIDTH